MGAVYRQRLTNDFWRLLEPTIEARGDMIDRLLGYLSDSDLSDLVETMQGDDDEDDTDE